GWKLQPIDTERMVALCQEFGFQSLTNQVRALARTSTTSVPGTPPAAPPGPVQGDLFAGEELFPFGANATEEAVAGEVKVEVAPAPVKPKGWQAVYQKVDTAHDFTAFLTQLRQQKRFAFDLESTSLQPLEAQLVGIAFSWQEGEAYYLPVRGPEGSALLDE